MGKVFIEMRRKTSMWAGIVRHGTEVVSEKELGGSRIWMVGERRVLSMRK